MALSRTSAFILGIVCGVLVSAALLYQSQLTQTLSSLEPTSSSAESANASGIQSSPGGAVSIADQKAGNQVMVSSVTVPPPGVWVAVQETNGDALGNVLGASLVRGPSSNVSVDLLRPTQSGHTYAIVLYRDDHVGGFDPALNSAYVDYDTGARVIALWKTLP